MIRLPKHTGSFSLSFHPPVGKQIHVLATVSNCLLLAKVHEVQYVDVVKQFSHL